jgi:hypothetical protein
VSVTCVPVSVLDEGGEAGVGGARGPSGSQVWGSIEEVMSGGGKLRVVIEERSDRGEKS